MRSKTSSVVSTKRKCSKNAISGNNSGGYLSARYTTYKRSNSGVYARFKATLEFFTLKVFKLSGSEIFNTSQTKNVSSCSCYNGLRFNRSSCGCK